MIYHVELYIFADIQLLIFIIAFKNKAVKIKIWLLQRYAAAAFCVMMLLRVKLFYLSVPFWGATQT